MAKIVFVQRVMYAFFGTMSLSAVLKQGGHHVEVVIEADPIRVAHEIKSIAPDLVAFSTLAATGELEWALSVVRNYKKCGVKSTNIFGGLCPTLFPEDVMAHEEVDLLCRGEGEIVFPQVCTAVDAGADYSRFPHLWVRQGDEIVRNPLGPLIADLDLLPFPDRELYQKYNYFSQVNSVDVMAGRACPYGCSYCYNHVYKKLYEGHGTFVRKHSVSYVINELCELQKRYAPQSLTFVDELFTFDRDWLRLFCQEYAQTIQLPFICNVRGDIVDEDIVRMLVDAGVFRVCLGVESGSQHIRCDVLNKPITDEQFLKSAELLHSHGVPFLTANMFALPGETIEDGFKTVTLNQRMKTDFLYCSVFQPYPGLRITAQAQAMGVFDPGDDPVYYSTYLKGSLCSGPDVHMLVNLHKLFFFAVKFPWLVPLIKALVRLPENSIFDCLFALSFGWMQLRCFKRNPLQLLKMGLRNVKVFCGSQRRE